MSGVRMDAQPGVSTTRRSGVVNSVVEHGDEVEITVLLAMVEPVADREAIRDLEADVSGS